MNAVLMLISRFPRSALLLLTDYDLWRQNCTFHSLRQNPMTWPCLVVSSSTEWGSHPGRFTAINSSPDNVIYPRDDTYYDVGD